jgi:GntR family transcriptional regulator, transcriptional repressor for pyruvate dehydrogenase complex
LAVDSLKDMLRLGQVDLQEVLHARLLLEPPIAAEAALKATPDDIARLEEANRIVRNGYKSKAADENNPILHKELAEIAGNAVLSLILNVLMEIHAYRMKDIKLDARGQKAILDQHERIIDAMKNRDKDSASDAMRNHIVETHKLLMKAESEVKREPPKPASGKSARLRKR